MMATINNNAGTKRRRRSDPSIAALRLTTDLPDAILAGVASYLPHTSCASLAMAMTSSDLMLSHRPSATCRAIASQVDWSTLDMGDIEKAFNCRLTDGHIRWLLTCIDSVSSVKSLKLTHCFHVSGAGLKPLRGSKVLEEIDLSLVGVHESPAIDPLPSISKEVVLPILDSIIETEGNSLSFVYLPKKWREEKSEMLSHFLGRYEELINDRRILCSGRSYDHRGRPVGQCDQAVEDEDEEYHTPWDEDMLQYYGMSKVACYKCKKCYCSQCRSDIVPIDFCECCEKFWCKECNHVDYCQGSKCPGSGQPSSCKGCGIVNTCDSCGEAHCSDCCSDWIKCQYCDKNCHDDCAYDIFVCRGEGCNKANCNGRDVGSRGQVSNACFSKNSGKADFVDDCRGWEDEWGCGSTYCTECRVEKCKADWQKSCTVCVKTIAPVLVDENERLRKKLEKSENE